MGPPPKQNPLGKTFGGPAQPTYKDESGLPLKKKKIIFNKDYIEHAYQFVSPKEFKEISKKLEEKEKKEEIQNEIALLPKQKRDKIRKAANEFIEGKISKKQFQKDVQKTGVKPQIVDEVEGQAQGVQKQQKNLRKD